MQFIDAAVRPNKVCERIFTDNRARFSQQSQFCRFDDSTHPPSTVSALVVCITVVLLSAWVQGQISGTNFGFQCGVSDTENCKGSGNFIAWPSVPTPGLIRLHASGTYWSFLEPSNGTFNWSPLDAWLDTIAAHQPMAVAYQFWLTPCWDATTCTAPDVDATGTSYPPSDLVPSGSPSLNTFVTAFVGHCSAAGNCVKDLIKYYQMYNEWDMPAEWSGTLTQLYQMITPAVAIIRANVPNAIVLMPQTTPADPHYACNFLAELNTDATAGPAGGRLSDWVDFHLYLTASLSSTNTPEQQWQNYVQNGSTGFLDLMRGATDSSCSPGPASAPGWSNVPWVNSETNFNGSADLQFVCPNPSQTPYDEYTETDCVGQVVRAQLLHDSNGASGLWWYEWMRTIGGVPQYETAYSYMMQYLLGGSFSAPCSQSTTAGAQTWTCAFNEQNGTNALWVWTPDEAGIAYSVPAGYADYRDLNGNVISISSQQSISISVVPLLLEGIAAPSHLTASVM